jgi:hypothetical protein
MDNDISEEYIALIFRVVLHNEDLKVYTNISEERLPPSSGFKCVFTPRPWVRVTIFLHASTLNKEAACSS